VDACPIAGDEISTGANLCPNAEGEIPNGGEAFPATGKKWTGNEKESLVTRSSLTSDHRPLTSICYEWHLADVERAEPSRKPKQHPQPVWFEPF
jgi:hypothetical protein